MVRFVSFAVVVFFSVMILSSFLFTTAAALPFPPLSYVKFLGVSRKLVAFSALFTNTYRLYVAV